MLEDVIRENLGQLFPGVGIRTAHMFRVVRDMEVAVTHPQDTAETILEVVDRGLREQRHGPVSLLEVEHGMPTRVLESARRKLRGQPRRDRADARPHGIRRLDGARRDSAPGPARSGR